MYDFFVENTALLLYFLPHPFQGIYLHLLGSKLKDVVDFCDRCNAVQFSKLPLLAKLGELLEIGTGVFVNCNEIGYRYEHPVTGQVFYHDCILGDYAYLGGHSVVGLGVEFQDFSGVGGRSSVLSFSTVQERTISVGNSGQFIMRRPNTDGTLENKVHSKKTPLFWKLIYMMKHVVSALNVSVPAVTLKLCTFQSFDMLQGYFNPSSVLETVVCAYIAFIVGLFLNTIILLVLCHTVYALPKRFLRGESAFMNSSMYNTWIQNCVMLVALQFSIQPFIAGTPLFGFLFRLLGFKVGKNFIGDSAMVSGIALYLFSFSSFINCGHSLNILKG